MSTSNREYRVETMDVETYSQSENFFWRWRLIALMQKIVDRYRFVPAKRRTPIWFVDKYLECFGCPLDDKQRRLLFDPDDSDVADEKGKTNIPRHLLKPHTSEILGIFASQVEWLVSNHVVRRKKLFDLTSWMEFAKEVQAKRKEAVRHGVKWGWPVGKEVEEESSEDDEGAGIDIDELVRNNPVIGKSNKVVARKIQLARAKLDCGARMSVSSGSGSEGDAPGGAEYVSDFSEPSDVEENDSDHRPAEEEAVNQIPWELRLAPLLPDVDGRWWCPLQGCNYQIDLHDLTEEKRRGVPGDLVEHILRKQWRNAAYDEKVLQGFRYMVTNHYVKHFEERGIKMEGREGMASHLSHFFKIFVNISTDHRHGVNSLTTDRSANAGGWPFEDQCLYEGRWEESQELFPLFMPHKQHTPNDERSVAQGSGEMDWQFTGARVSRHYAFSLRQHRPLEERPVCCAREFIIR